MRTWLFVPGHDARKMRKALASSADVVIIDWEDAVPGERKDEARQMTHSQLAQASPAPRCVVRINSRQTTYYPDDIKALAGLPISGVLLPKVDSPDDVVDLANHFAHPLIPILESALGIERAFEIATAHSLIERLSFGPLDFLADLGVQWAPHGELNGYACSRVAIAGRAAGLQGAIDGVYPLLDDQEGLRREAARARALGFVGKMVLHPAQLPIVSEVFSPAPEEVARAREIMQAFHQARAKGESAVRLRDVFIDPPVVRWAEQVLAMSGGSAAEGLHDSL